MSFSRVVQIPEPSRPPRRDHVRFHVRDLAVSCPFQAQPTQSSHYSVSLVSSLGTTVCSNHGPSIPLPKPSHWELSGRSSSFHLTDNTYVQHPQASLPNKRYHSMMRNLRWTIMTVYRRLCVLVIIVNITAMIILASQNKLLNSTPDTAAGAVAANLCVGVLIRQELIINSLFWLFGNCPQSAPLRLRRSFAKIYHLGGVHSGAGISAALWFGIFNHSILRVFRHKMEYKKATGRIVGPSNAVPAITVLLDLLFIAVLTMAHPAIRARIHNVFELVHRFAGWSAIVLFWIQFGILTCGAMEYLETNSAPQIAIAETPGFWLLVIITISIVFPWLWLRKVPVHCEPLSSHAVRLHFTYSKLSHCVAPRFSDNPLFEWHAFAGIPSDDGNGFSVIVSRAGDWTARLISHPPTEIWVRGIPTLGVLHMASIFRRIILVATGSGIGPILSLLATSKVTARILWSTRDPATTYSAGVIKSVHRADPDAVVVNTSIARGRPNLTQITYELYTQYGAEAVFIISNPKVTRTTVYHLESRGVPTFAPIFDS